MPTKIELQLSPERLDDFIRRCYETPGGDTRLATIVEIAAEFGVKISMMSAMASRDGVIKDRLDALRAKSERAQRVAAYGRAGLGLTEAASVRLAESVFDKLDAEDGVSLTPEETDTYSRVIERARLGDQRQAKLTADLKLRDEQLAKARAEAQERAEKAAAAKAALEGLKSKGGLTADTLKRIEEAAGLL